MKLTKTKKKKTCSTCGYIPMSCKCDEELKPINWVSCEVVSTIGYHDIHEVGDIIQVDRKHVDEMIVKGFVRVIGSECI